MTATQQTLRDAVTAGFFKGIDPSKPFTINMVGGVSPHYSVVIEQENSSNRFTLGAVLITPEFWQAVGKERQWRYEDETGTNEGWRGQWHTFINWLANGLSIEEALSKLV